MTFSRAQSKLNAVATKQRRARIQAKQGHPGMKLKHPDWCRDANKGQYTLLNNKIKEDCEKKQQRNEIFQRKLHKHD